MKLIDFSADWCGPCTQQEPIVEEIDDEYENVEVQVVDVDEDQATANKYGVQALPTLVVEDDDDGDIIQRFTGLTSKEKIVAALED